MPRGPPNGLLCCSHCRLKASDRVVYIASRDSPSLQSMDGVSVHTNIFIQKVPVSSLVHPTSGQMYKWYFTSGVMCYHSLFGFPFSCTVPTVTNAQCITPNTINREIQINLRNITRETQQTFQTPLFGTHCEALQQPAAIETADNRKSCNCSGDSGDFLYIHIITVTGIIYRKKEKIWCKKLSPPKNTGDWVEL